jgi:methylated-DNA-[protein]-cysteine S-methyltransferase
MATEQRAYYRSPIGTVEIVGTDEGVTAVSFVRRERAGATHRHPVLEAAVSEIDEYFGGKRRVFSVSLSTAGTSFQEDIWRQLVRIPYGKTTTYGELARAVGRPKAVRAVGQANHRNPVSIIIPCHRVIGGDGRLVGYGGGLWRKEWLLAHERGTASGSSGVGEGRRRRA